LGQTGTEIFLERGLDTGVTKLPDEQITSAVPYVGRGQQAVCEIAPGRVLERPAVKRFAQKSAHFLAELNAIHAFREGNGRAQNAMITSFNADEGPLVALIGELIADE
jgi:hypothetical protein